MWDFFCNFAPEFGILYNNMKVLILSANTGEGHNSSARAILQAMEARGFEAEMRDVLSIGKKNATSTNSKNVSKAYVESTKGFNIFSKVYALAAWISKHWNGHKHSPIYWVNKMFWRRLWHYIDDNHFDAVVAVHLFAAEKLTALKREGKLHVPAIFVMTDYTIHPFLNDSELDYYVIPHKDLIPLWVENGFKEEELVPIGIPVDTSKFDTRLPMGEARKKVAKALGFELKESDAPDQNSRWYLMMSGSMGFGNMAAQLKTFARDMRPNSRVICVCGRNEQNLKVIKRDFADDWRICPVGFTDKIPLIMDACDVVLSKPGGITTTESFIKNIPLVHTAPIPGIEDENAKFCHARNMSYYSESLDAQVQAAIRLANDAEYREDMQRCQRENTDPQTCEKIIDLIVKEVNARK